MADNSRKLVPCQKCAKPHSVEKKDLKAHYASLAAKSSQPKTGRPSGGFTRDAFQSR